MHPLANKSAFRCAAIRESALQAVGHNRVIYNEDAWPWIIILLPNVPSGLEINLTHTRTKISFYKAWLVCLLLLLLFFPCNFLLTEYQMKELESQQFSISNFWWIYTFWDVFIRLLLFLQNVCLSLCVWHKICGRARVKTDGWSCVEFYI